MKTENIKNSIKKNFSENKVILFVFLFLWAALIVFTLNRYNATLGKQSVGNESYNKSVVEINQDTSLFALIPVEENAESVCIQLATYARNNSGTLNVRIEGNNSGTIYVDETVSVGNIVDNDYRTYPLSENLSVGKDSQLKISISSDSQPGKGAGVYYSNDKWFEDSILKTNQGELEDCDLCVKYLLHNDDLKGFATGIILWSIVGITLIGLMLLLLNPKKEVLFLILVLVLGIVMMIIIVPASPPDELSHYEVAMQISNLMMFKEQRQIDSIYLKYGYMFGHFNISAGYIRFIREIFQPLKLTGQIEYLSRNVMDVYWIQYIPNAIGFTIGRLLKMNMITTFYMGRLSGLLFYAACIYYAIKKTPAFKTIFGMIAIMPMFLQTAASITYDTFILGLSFLSAAYLVRWYFAEDEISLKEYLLVLLICFLLAPAKVVYGFFSFLFFFIPSARFGGLKKKLLLVLILCLPALYQLYDIMSGPLQILLKSILRLPDQTTAQIRYNSQASVSDLIGRKGTYYPDEGYSFSYIFRHPAETFMIFYRTIRYRIKFWFYGSFGRTLSGSTLIIPIGIVHLMTAILFLSAFLRQQNTFRWTMKTAILMICAIIGIYIIIGMFVSWTESSQVIVEDFGGIIVEGVQGRYFSPLLPFFFPIFANPKIAIPEKMDKYLILSYLMVFFEIVIYVLSYTFVN